MLEFLLILALTGLVIGALARLVVPGPNPMGLLLTMLVGVVGSLLGGYLSDAFGVTGWVRWLVAVLVAAVLVYFVAGASGVSRRRRMW